ncbi:hypothetical protein LguiA_036571 [Lonicera macranthoides]
MKFMKLGSKPDAFHSEGNSIRYVSSELAPDAIIIVGEVKFYLHKFPLLSKSNRLQKLVSNPHEDSHDEIDLSDIPGGPKAFEICAKFCYGMTVTLNPYNVVAARCAAEYLEMTEHVDRGNLIFKIEVFLNSSVFRSWKDSIIVLQTSASLLPWSENLKVVGRCIDSIASKTSVDPATINWSYTYNRKLALLDKIVEKTDSVPKDWWVEDICELEIDLYKRVMIGIKSKGRMNGNVIGEALKTYAVRWLPDSVDALVSEPHNRRNKSLVETIICLLPNDKAVGCSCSFLLKLLKVAILVGADDSSREDLIKTIGLKLDEALVNDILIPAQAPQTTIYDVALVKCLVNRFAMTEKCRQDLDSVERNENSGDFIWGHGSWLKEHPNLTKAEKKKLCGLMDVKKLMMEASRHAAQNERLPLRVVVQVLFFEQVRAAAGVQAVNRSSKNGPLSISNNEEDWVKKVPVKSKSLREQMSQMKIKDEDHLKNMKLIKKGSKRRGSAVQLLPSRSRRIFDKLWVVGKGHGENRSSETSASSQSPTSMVRGENKSSGSSSRNRRHSIS